MFFPNVSFYNLKCQKKCKQNAVFRDVDSKNEPEKPMDNVSRVINVSQQPIISVHIMVIQPYSLYVMMWKINLIYNINNNDKSLLMMRFLSN